MTAPPLEPMAGEAPREQVFQGQRGDFRYVVNREYESGPWSWVILDGTVPIAAGDAGDHRKALIDLGAELDLLSPPPPERKGGGLVGLFGRLLWGDNER